MADITELCATNGCQKAQECAKKLEPDSQNVRVSKFSPDIINKRFHCIGFQKHYGRR